MTPPESKQPRRAPVAADDTAAIDALRREATAQRKAADLGHQRHGIERKGLLHTGFGEKISA